MKPYLFQFTTKGLQQIKTPTQRNESVAPMYVKVASQIHFYHISNSGQMYIKIKIKAKD